MAVAAESRFAVEPGLTEVRELARAHNVIPLRHTFIDDCETPVSAFLKLRGSEPCFLLESAEQGQVGRYSFLGFRPRAVLRLEDGVLTERGAGGENKLECADPFAAVADYVARFSPAPLPGLPPFSGGALGFFGYDLVRSIESLAEPNPDEVGMPDMALMLTDVVLSFDHLRHEVTVLANVFCESGEDVEQRYGEAVAAIEEVRDRLAGPVPAPPPREPREPEPFVSNLTREQFEGMVERIIEYIHAGDAFQVVPSQRWSAPAAVEPFSIYRGLRAVNPSPYMYYLEFEDFAIAGASPEPLITVNGRNVQMRPIAGTRPRAGSAEEDRRRAEDLLKDAKERAEHIMLVDLGRNDLGRVCDYGTVTVDELMAVEIYSHVMHIVSSVSGTLREGVGAMDALRAVLPAGTLSGAPKVRAMEIIDELEPSKRGPYGGAVGYLSFSGDLDTCIHIRTVVVKDGIAHVQAGGGTVADAKPDYEYEESVAKASAVFKAIELAARQPDWA